MKHTKTPIIEILWYCPDVKIGILHVNPELYLELEKAIKKVDVE